MSAVRSISPKILNTAAKTLYAGPAKALRGSPEFGLNRVELGTFLVLDSHRRNWENLFGIYS